MPSESMSVRERATSRHKDGLWEIGEVAEYLKCKPRTIWRRIKYDGLPYLKIGRRTLFRPADVDAWVDERAA